MHISCVSHNHSHNCSAHRREHEYAVVLLIGIRERYQMRLVLIYMHYGAIYYVPINREEGSPHIHSDRNVQDFKKKKRAA